ncbi:MAG: NUDIX hydrolase [Paracoccaceae bacterium]
MPAFSIDRVAHANIHVSAEAADLERVNADAILANWESARAENPSLFNGVVHLCAAAEIVDDTIHLTCHQVRFATLLYWRLCSPGSGLRNTFGDIILRCSDGGILLGRMARHTANAGRLSLPGGSFDASDVEGGRIDPRGGIRRECAEETGFGADDYVLDEDLIVYRDDRRVAFAQVARLPLTSAEACARVRAFLATESPPEFEDITVVPGIAEADRLIRDTYERHLIAHVFEENWQ